MMLLANSLSKPRREQIKREQQENDIEIVKVKKKVSKTQCGDLTVSRVPLTGDASQFRSFSKSESKRNLLLIIKIESLQLLIRNVSK